MISFRLKIIVLCTGLLFLLMHFALVFFYKPEGIPRNKIEYYSSYYVYPFFHQSWQLFAPPPDSNWHLYAQFEKNGTQKIDLFREILVEHQSNRLKGYEPLLIAFTNSIHYFEKNTRYKDAVNGPISNDLYFTMLEFSSINYLKYKYGIEDSPVRLILVVQNTTNGKKKVFFNHLN